MKITVLNGSPKGNLSVTMQYVNFIQKKFPQHELKIFNVAPQIRKWKKKKDLPGDDGGNKVFRWGALGFPPVYLLIPSQYKRFIELIWERETGGCF